jgi:hypothetical protein
VHHANSSLLFHSLDLALEELEVQVKQAEEANPEPKPEQGKPQYITPSSLTFVLNYYLYVKVNYALG